MEVLKDYPKEFAKLFRPSFNYLLKINMKFLAKDEGFVKKYWRFLYIIPWVVINYFTLSWNLGKMMAGGDVFEIAYRVPPVLVCTQGAHCFSFIFNFYLHKSLYSKLLHAKHVGF